MGVRFCLAKGPTQALFIKALFPRALKAGLVAGFQRPLDEMTGQDQAGNLRRPTRSIQYWVSAPLSLIPWNYQAQN